MSMLLDLPLELQLSIYEGSGNLHLKEVCQEVKEVFDANLYGMNDFLTKTNVKQKTISQVSVDVVKKYSNDKELMTDLILRSIPQPKPSYTPGFGFFSRMNYGMNFGMAFDMAYDMAYNDLQFMSANYSWNHIRTSRFKYLFLNLPHYDIIKKQTEVTFDPIILNDIESMIEKLIKTNDKETIMKLVEIHSDLTNKSPNYTKILKICASNNNFELYKEFYTVIKNSDQDSYNIVSIFTDDYLEYFVKYENISALEYFHKNMNISYDKIVTHSIKIISHHVFDQYFNKINHKDNGRLIAHINNSIKYNNLYAFKRLLCRKDVIKILLEEKCIIYINNKEKETNYIHAIRESCNCNKEFANFMDSMISKFLSIIVLPSIDINELLIMNQTTNSKKMYNPDIKFNKFKNVQYMKYQQRSHKNYNKQKFIKH